MAGPIAVQKVGDRGLVWSIPDVLQLRRHYKLIGSMIGGIAGFQSQVSVLGLPLQLSAEEVGLALRAGWIELFEARCAIPTAATAAAAAAAAAALPQGEQDAMQLDGWALDEHDEFYAAYYGLEAAPQQQPGELQGGDAAAGDQQQHNQQQRQAAAPAAWQAAMASSSKVAVPLTVADAVAARAGVRGGGGSGGSSLAAQPGESGSNTTQQQQQQQQQQQEGRAAPPPLGLAPAAWALPRTPQQHLRLAVFADLYARGFALTGGAKFGGDLLAYPGDPQLYHAQYVVRVLPPRQLLRPTVLQGLARGVHAARKHLLLATVLAGGGDTAAGEQQGGGLGCVGGRDPGLREAAAAVAAAAASAAAAGFWAGFGGGGGSGSSRAPASPVGRLRYITIVRDSGWGAE